MTYPVRCHDHRMPHRRSRRGTRRPRDQRGAAAVEFLIVAAVLLLLFSTLVQFGIRAHANRIAEAAAREGAVHAARWDGTAGSGQAKAREFTSRGAPAVRSTSTSGTRSATLAQVTVTVRTPVLVPWLNSPITSSATAPVERFVE